MKGSSASYVTLNFAVPKTFGHPTTVAGNDKNNIGRVKRFNPRSPEITVKICCTVARTKPSP